jgi:predicted small secreted protein
MIRAMKRILLLAALALGVLSMASCGLVNNTANTLGRTVRSVTSTVGLN